MDGTSEHSGAAVAANGRRGTAAEVLLVFLRLGLTSFGGPIAHIGYFHEEFVVLANGSTSRPMSIWSRCASFCRGRLRARSDFPSA